VSVTTKAGTIPAATGKIGGLLDQYKLLCAVIGSDWATRLDHKVASIVIDRYRHKHGNGRASLLYLHRATGATCQNVIASLRRLTSHSVINVARRGIGTRPTEYGLNFEFGTQPASTTVGDSSPDAERAGEASPPDLDALLNDAASAFQQASVAQPPDVTAEIRGKLEPLAHAVAAVQARQEAAQNKADWDNVVRLGKEAVAGFDHLPADFAETWLMAESIRNPQLRKAFDERYSSPEAKHWAETRFKKAMFSLYKAARSVPDRQATEDRAAITAWMTRGAGKAPEPAPPNYGAMTDAEFTAEKAKLGV
jgi:hypothetical protein